MAMQLVLPQMSATAERSGIACGEAVRDSVSEETGGPCRTNEDTGPVLLQAARTRENLNQAFKRVRTNQVAAGGDGMDLDQTAKPLVAAWPARHEEAFAGP